MKLYLASFLEEDNFGPGRLICIARGNKPWSIEVDIVFAPFVPTQELMSKYREMADTGQEGAGEMFQTSFQKQLDAFYDKVLKKSEETKQTPQEVLPFQEGDTLCSWEREHRTHYRKQIESVLVKLGYDIISK